MLGSVVVHTLKTHISMGYFPNFFLQKLFLRRLIINHRQKHLSACLIALAALLSTPIQGAWAATAPALGTASGLSVLAGTAVTCSRAAVTGNVGVSPGSVFTNTGCTITGMTPPDTNVAAVGAHTDFLSAYATLQLQSSSCIQMLGNLANQNLGPGVYCVEAVAKTGMLTLTGPSDGVWIFLVNGALTGNTLPGDAAIGSIPLTRGTLTGQALANVAVTMTGTSVAGSGGCHPDYLLNPFGP